MRHKCPNCGTGPLYKSYLKPRDTCVVCGEELHHHRADDGPAYLTILVAGHLMAPMILIVWELFRPEPIYMATGFIALFVVMSLYLLPIFKGMIIGIQWAKRMYGFDGAPARHDENDGAATPAE